MTSAPHKQYDRDIDHPRDGETGVHAGNLFKTKSPGNGLRLVEESGRFRFKVDAAIANWTLKVIQLTAEEAKQYTPKEKLD